MGLLIDGVWHDKWYDTKKTKGEFVREQARFRHWVTADGSAGPTGDAGFKAEAGRYHLYVSLACPWAHRTLIFRKLKGLEDVISLSVVHPHMLENGWTFRQDDGSSSDSLFGYDYMHQIYTRAHATYSGRVTVPVLWDKQQDRLVNNESADIIRMFNSAFNDITGNHEDFRPAAQETEIDELNQLIYDNVNNGVYRCGFATEQAPYEQAFDRLFEVLDQLEERLAGRRFLHGDRITETDIRLFTTLIRFDAVYYGHFKTNLRRIEEYPHLAEYLRDLYQQPGMADTVDFYHIKEHYYVSQRTVNPSGVVPKGPLLDYHRPHGRAKLTAS